MPRQPAIYAIILAAGRSSLGFPKALARFGEQTALDIAVSNCAGLATPIVVLGSEAALIRPHLPTRTRVILNRRWRSGQLSSLLLALRYLPPGADFILYPVDYPLVTREIVQSLITAFRRRAPGHSIIVPSHRGRTGHPIVMPGELRRELTKAKTAREVVYRAPQRTMKIEVNSTAICRDLDTPAAYRRALKEYETYHQRPETKRGSTTDDSQPATRAEFMSPGQKPWESLKSVRAPAARHRNNVAARKNQAASASSEFYDSLAPLARGAPLTPALACRLITCPDCDLRALLAAARDVRDQFKPGIITYSRKVFLPLTNLCRDYCGYCIFRRDPGQPGAHTMTPDEVLRVAREGERLGCREALFSLGDKPEQAFPEMRSTLRRLGFRSTLHYLEAMCDLVLRQTTLIPHANPGLMSAAWLRRLRAVSPSVGLMLESTNALSRAAHRRAPDKVPALRLKTIAEAGKQRIPFTTGILVGIGESPRDRVNSLFAILDLHRRYGHIQEVIIQNFRVKPAIPMSYWPEPSRGEMLRTIAVARLVLRHMNIQAPPNLSAPNYEELLSAGINDWGGISPLTPDFINPERPWPHLAELRRRTEAAGYALKQRLPVYSEFLPLVEAARGLAAEKTLAAAMLCRDGSSGDGRSGRPSDEPCRDGSLTRPAGAQSRGNLIAARSAS